MVSAPGSHVGRLVKNIHELNLSLSVVSLPWDGPPVVSGLSSLGGQANLYLSVTPRHYLMPEFMAEYAEANNLTERVYEWPVVWQIAKKVPAKLFFLVLKFKIC